MNQLPIQTERAVASDVLVAFAETIIVLIQYRSGYFRENAAREQLMCHFCVVRDLASDQFQGLWFAEVNADVVLFAVAFFAALDARAAPAKRRYELHR